MHRVYDKDADLHQPTIIIRDAKEAHHALHVLRLKPSDEIIVFNQSQQQARVRITAIDHSLIKGDIIECRDIPLPKVPIILVCAVPKKDKFEWIVEKATELGVAAIYPLATTRGEVVFPAERAAAKLQRLERIVVSAAKQSGNAQMPHINPMMDLKATLLQLPPNAYKMLLSLQENAFSIRQAVIDYQPLSQAPMVIIVGPEGDFTPQEIDLALKAGCHPVSLGPQVLRVETAAIGAVSFVRFLLQD